MAIAGRRMFVGMVLGTALALAGLVPRPVTALEAGEPAPEFTLPSTNGVDIGLREFRGKKFVFLEFYGLDFQPT